MNDDTVDDADRRPKSSYLLFLDSIRHEQRGEAARTFMQKAGRRWRKMSDAQKMPFKRRAEILMEEWKAYRYNEDGELDPMFRRERKFRGVRIPSPVHFHLPDKTPTRSPTPEPPPQAPLSICEVATMTQEQLQALEAADKVIRSVTFTAI